MKLALFWNNYLKHEYATKTCTSWPSHKDQAYHAESTHWSLFKVSNVPGSRTAVELQWMLMGKSNTIWSPIDDQEYSDTDSLLPFISLDKWSQCTRLSLHARSLRSWNIPTEYVIWTHNNDFYRLVTCKFITYRLTYHIILVQRHDAKPNI